MKDTHGYEHDEILDSDCLEAFDHVYAYINGELEDEATIVKIEHHLSHCKSCYSRAQMERKINERLKASAEPVAPEQLQTRLKRLIEDF